MLSIAFASLFAVVAMASPASIAGRADCTAIRSGILSANLSGAMHPFLLNKKNQVSYNGSYDSPLKVQFQECKSLEVGLPTDQAKAGRLYVPSKNKCIAITNQQNKVGPYYTTLASCNTKPPQRWSLRLDMNNAIFWTGDSDFEGTIRQGGCGSLGYRSNPRGVPIHTHSNDQITVECKNMTQFAIRVVPI